jgi:hypothetical protein
MRSYGSPMKEAPKSPKDGQQRTVDDRDGGKHLEYFRNGSWRHSSECRARVNKDCRR